MTHFPILAACLARSSGPVLELGTGDGSTPLIHYAACGVRRFVVSADGDLAWLRKYSEGYACPRRHEFIHVGNWDEFSILEALEWGVALVDCAPGEARYKLAMRLANRCKWVILHDTEKDYNVGTNYTYERATPSYKYVTEFRRFRPYTMVCSNVERFGIEPCDRIWEPPK